MIITTVTPPMILQAFDRNLLTKADLWSAIKHDLERRKLAASTAAKG